MSKDDETPSLVGFLWAFLFSAILWALIVLGFCFGTGCTPISKAESQRINSNYNDYYNRTRGVKVRR